MSKAATAMTLDKQYEQDEPIRWGFLTKHEKSHRLVRKPSKHRTAWEGRPTATLMQTGLGCGRRCGLFADSVQLD